jgi:hypothetical protein
MFRLGFRYTSTMYYKLFHRAYANYAPEGYTLWIMPGPGWAIQGATKNKLERGTAECLKLT